MSLLDANAPHQIVPIVAPISRDPAASGRVKNLAVGGGTFHRQIMAIGPGEYAIHPRYAKQGWAFLEDLYAAEDNMAGWELYQRYLHLAATGRTSVSFPFDRLPREVQTRQRCGVPDDFADEFAVKPTTGKIDAGDPVEPEARGKRRAS